MGPLWDSTSFTMSLSLLWESGTYQDKIKVEVLSQLVLDMGHRDIIFVGALENARSGDVAIYYV